jgi:ribonuclease BN (tRNA processing enzyme)
MRVTLIPSSVSGEALQFLTSFLINDTLAIDAGSLGLYLTPREQGQVKHILISHSHLDHLASLPIFLDTVYDGSGDCVTIHASGFVLDVLRKDMFSNRLYPDFIHISTIRPPYLKLSELKAGQPVELEGLHITPVEVNHAVPTLGFVIRDAAATVVIPSDTGPTEEIWQVASRAPNLKAVFLEMVFPEAMGWLADIAKHLTPSLFAREMQKVPAGVQFLAVHIHPRHRQQVIREMEALGLAHVEPCQAGVVYEF